jgi:formiminotetrahydrofolate cyclodeaminase
MDPTISPDDSAALDKFLDAYASDKVEGTEDARAAKVRRLAQLIREAAVEPLGAAKTPVGLLARLGKADGAGLVEDNAQAVITDRLARARSSTARTDLM